MAAHLWDLGVGAGREGTRGPLAGAAPASPFGGPPGSSSVASLRKQGCVRPHRGPPWAVRGDGAVLPHTPRGAGGGGAAPAHALQDPGSCLPVVPSRAHGWVPQGSRLPWRAMRAPLVSVTRIRSPTQLIRKYRGP